MANPQLENGYLMIAMEIAKVFARINIYPHENRILWVIFQKTYGWHKKEDWISLSQFAKETGLDRRIVHRTLKKLASMGMIIINKDDKYHVKYSFQKDYEKWNMSSTEMTGVIQTYDNVSSNQSQNVIKSCHEVSSNQSQNVIKSDDKVSSNQSPTKDIYTKYTSTKETIQKKESKTIYKDTHIKALTPPIDAPPYIQELESESPTPTPTPTLKPKPKKSKEPYKHLNNTVTILSNKRHSTPSPSTISYKNEDIPYADIVDYLNKKTNKSFRVNNNRTQKLIKARWTEGNTLEDFYKVIDHQTAKWINDHKMREYLRPETLFGPKFESYLQSPPTVVQAGIMLEGTATIMGWADRQEERERRSNNGNGQEY